MDLGKLTVEILSSGAHGARFTHLLLIFDLDLLLVIACFEFFVGTLASCSAGETVHFCRDLPPSVKVLVLTEVFLVFHVGD